MLLPLKKKGSMKRKRAKLAASAVILDRKGGRTNYQTL